MFIIIYCILYTETPVWVKLKSWPVSDRLQIICKPCMMLSCVQHLLHFCSTWELLSTRKLPCIAQQWVNRAFAFCKHCETAIEAAARAASSYHKAASMKGALWEHLKYTVSVLVSPNSPGKTVHFTTQVLICTCHSSSSQFPLGLCQWQPTFRVIGTGYWIFSLGPISTPPPHCWHYGSRWKQPQHLDETKIDFSGPIPPDWKLEWHTCHQKKSIES